MKYAIILGDGMADYPIAALDNKTPLQVAAKPCIDALAAYAEVGLVRTVPVGMKPGSDVANLSVMGYNPADCYTGRSPLEAVSIGLTLSDTDVTLRCNLVTLSDEPNYEDKTMLDYSAGEISTEEARELIEYLAKHFNDGTYALYPGVSYRHCLLVHGGKIGHDLTPPHDISDKKITEYLPKGECAQTYLAFMKKSSELLAEHPVNKARVAQGKNPANSVWFWGEGTKPRLEGFTRKTGLKGGVISAVDLIRGIGILAGMQVIEVPDITGNYHTNFVGKANAALNALLGGLDYVYIHMEAPDECGHQGDLKNKIYSIEQVDNVTKILTEGLQKAGEDYKILVCPDHPTPICCKTHVSDPVPYLLYDSTKQVQGVEKYDEQHAANTGTFVERGWDLLDKLIR